MQSYYHSPTWNCGFPAWTPSATLWHQVHKGYCSVQTAHTWIPAPQLYPCLSTVPWHQMGLLPRVPSCTGIQEHLSPSPREAFASVIRVPNSLSWANYASPSFPNPGSRMTGIQGHLPPELFQYAAGILACLTKVGQAPLTPHPHNSEQLSPWVRTACAYLARGRVDHHNHQPSVHPQPAAWHKMLLHSGLPHGRF